MRTAALGIAALLAASCGGGLSEAAQRGRVVFWKSSRPTCASCHTLAEAGSISKVGPDLDQLRPTRARVLKSVTQGVGIMPSQAGILTEQQIDDVATYVIEAMGQ